MKSGFVSHVLNPFNCLVMQFLGWSLATQWYHGRSCSISINICSISHCKRFPLDFHSFHRWTLFCFSGVKIIEDCHVKEILTEKQRAGQYDRVTSAVTSQGNIKCDVFINCTGMVCRCDWKQKRRENRSISSLFQWARELGFQSLPNVRIPIQACGKLDSLRKNLRLTDAFSARIYLFEN